MGKNRVELVCEEKEIDFGESKNDCGAKKKTCELMQVCFIND